MVVAPPLYRHRPAWYQTDLAQIALRFSELLSTGHPPNLSLLPSFLSQDLGPNGVHLTPVSGLHYVIHLFDHTMALLEDRTSDMRLNSVQEAVRHHDDRLVFLENRHGQLSRDHILKIASDAEFRDSMLNRADEEWLTIMGLKRLSSDLSKRDWQNAVKKQVADFLSHVLKAHRSNLNFIVVFVDNPVKQRTSGLPVLNVKLNSVDVSKRIRDLYSGFFSRANSVQLPPSMKGISVRNKVTHDTRIRIAILQQLAANYKTTNPNSSVHVRGYGSSPTLFILPAQGSTSKPRTFNFIDAV